MTFYWSVQVHVAVHLGVIYTRIKVIGLTDLELASTSNFWEIPQNSNKLGTGCQALVRVTLYFPDVISKPNYICRKLYKIITQKKITLYKWNFNGA